MAYKTIIFLLFICTSISAQDTIFRRDQSVVCAKVEEISENAISYKRCEMLDGPVYILNTSEIYKIKYKNGSVDTFQLKATQSLNNKPDITNYKSYSTPNAEQIQKAYKRNTYLYQSMPISHKKIFMMSFEKNRVWNDKELSQEIFLAKDCQKKQYYFGFGGLGVGIFGTYGTALFTANSNNSSLVSSAIVFNSIGILIASQFISKSYKKQRLKHTAKVVDIYNSHF